VIDKERGIYRTRARGLYTFDPKTGEFGDAPDDAEDLVPPRRDIRHLRTRISWSFGDIWLLREFLVSGGLMACVDATGIESVDTVRALLCFYMLSSLENSHALDWWEDTFAHLLFPGARMDTDHVMEALADFGREDTMRVAMREYLKLVGSNELCVERDPVEGAILIDAIGVLYSARLHATSVLNHDGSVSREVRLISVADREAGLPLFFCHDTDDASDLLTVTQTVSELKGLGVDIGIAILDADCYSHAYADAMSAAGIPFLARAGSTSDLHREIIAKCLDSLEALEHAFDFHGRPVCVDCTEVMIGSQGDICAYAYLCKDSGMVRELEREAEMRAEPEEFDALAEEGIFVLVSTEQISKERLLDLYHRRSQVTEVYEIFKADPKMVPLYPCDEDAFQGHLLVRFFANVAQKLMSDVLESADTDLDLPAMFSLLHEHHVQEWEGELLTEEPRGRMEKAYRAFGIVPPEVIELPKAVD